VLSEYEAMVGLEVHVQLKTASKLFCGCSAAYGGEPNTRVCPICLGMPGVLPKINKRAVEFTIKMVLATGGTVKQQSIFARKNYFYPDLPKGYQISQYEFPIATGGAVMIQNKGGRQKKIRLSRIHLEEEAGKLFHDVDKRSSYVDFNRCGIPLIEIVTEPDLRSGEEAYIFLDKIKQIVEYLDICTGNMEEGAIRCDINVSVRPEGNKDYGTRREIKNMNSLKFTERAINYEKERQIEIIKSGGKISQETMLWDERAGVTKLMRTKEESEDYRYFPEPDLMHLKVAPGWVEGIKKNIPELPDEKYHRFIKQYGIPAYDARVLTSSRSLADYFENVTFVSKQPKLASNWVMVELMQKIKKTDISQVKVKPENLGVLIEMIATEEISSKMAKDVFAEMIKTGRPAEEIVEAGGLKQISDKVEINKAVKLVLDNNRVGVRKYHGGKEGLFGFFVGQVMRATNNKANPRLVNEILKDELNKRKGR
jgi:aspartyl-tRNA(Asn)/glutamyl-tRNA(Gln) amidotransferase subunit B